MLCFYENCKPLCAEKQLGKARQKKRGALDAMAQQGQELGAGMSDEDFYRLCTKVCDGETAEVLAAVDNQGS